MKYRPSGIDWRWRGDYIRLRHRIRPAWADEAALSDPFALWINPDPASASGRSIRVIGYSESADSVLVVILLPADAGISDRPDGTWWGVNAWLANDRDQRIYRERQARS